MDVALAIIPSSGAPSRLRAPDPGELLLVFHPTGSRWLGLAIDGRHPTTAVELGPLAAEPTSDEALATALFTPFRAQLAEAKVLTLYPSGGLDARDLHALPFDGRRLVEHLPVRYGIDLPGERTNLALPLRTAFVVADPQGDLPESRAEAETLVHHLRDAGWSVEALVGPAATSLAFAAQLRRGHGLLHYAGHGAFEGIDGWSSALPLAAGVAFGVSDVLASPSVPARVVLSACESGRSEPGGQVASLGLAQAFLVAGAREVVATTRPIRDATARLVAEHLHADPDEPLADGLRRAQQAAWAARVADASAYRVYVR
jgi:CHAT domain-containing protein